ncbi:hypothetical protein MMC20_007977 [Loxospora ochrophaea]|nr:hypothetical protein [Loxospora ochrophaea]
MSSPSITTGTLPFSVPSANKPCETWYTIRGTLSPSTAPLVVLHGGAGMPHEHVLPLADLASPYGIPVVIYDQIGCGNSTHLPEKRNEPDFWKLELFLAELDNLLSQLNIKQNYNLFGHSWGGMLAAEHAVLRPHGLKKLILASPPADMKTWEAAANRLKAQLPTDVQEVIDRHEKAGTYESGEYQQAVGKYYAKHFCRLEPPPEDLGVCYRKMLEDPTVLQVINGPSEFHITGIMKDWSVVDRLHLIDVPALLINGRYDAAQNEVVEPFFRLIRKVKWVQFARSSHMPHYEEREAFREAMGGFLEG